MPAAIPVTGFPSDYRTPDVGIEILFAQGESISGSGSRTCVLVGPKLSTGTYTANTLYGPINSPDEVGAGAGLGSALHRAARKIAAADKTLKVYILPFAETSGGSPVQAVGNLVISGTATADFVWTIPVVDDEVSVFVRTGDTAATVATNIRAATNAKTWLPVTAAGSTTTVAFTSKHYGVRGGNGTYNPFKIGAVAPGNGLTATFADVGATTAGADGSTTEAAALTTALATIDSQQFYYLGYDFFGNSTAMAAVKAHIAAKNSPRTGLLTYGISGYNGTTAAYTTIANGLNYECIECGVQPYAPSDPATIMGQLIATHHLNRETRPQAGFVNYAGAEWSLKPSPAAYALDKDDINDIIAAGGSPIVSKTGGTYLAMSLTTRSKDASGTYADFRAAESHRISIAHYCATDLKAAIAPQLGQGFMEHPKLPNGKPDPNARIPDGVATDFTIKPMYLKKMRQWYEAGMTQKLEQSQASLNVVKSPINAGRLESGFSLYSIDILSQITVRMAESSAA
jgi:phage tail sheath gpL-like